MAWKYVKVNGMTVPHQLGTLSGSFSSSAPPQWAFEVKKSYTGALPQIGEPVAAYRGNDTKVFGGIVTNIEWIGFWESSGDLRIKVTCVGKMDRLFRRTTRNNSTGLCAEFHSFAGKVDTSGTAVTWKEGDKFSPYLSGKTIVIGTTTYTVASSGVTDPDHLTLTATAGTQTDAVYNRVEYSGYAVKTLLDTFCAGEGFTYDGSSIQDGAAVKSVYFDPPVPVYAAIQQLLDGNPDFFLNVDANGKVYFAARTLVAAPADFTDSSSAYKRKIRVSESRDDVRNVEISVISWDTVDPVVESLAGDGSKNSWFTTKPIGQISTALLNGAQARLETVGFNAYYSGRVNVSADGATITRVDGSYFDAAMVGSLLRIDGEVASVSVVGTSGSVSVGVGITGPQTNAYYSLSLGSTGTADFYYRQNDYSVWADPATAVLGSGDVLEITHKPFGGNHFETKDATDISDRAAIETDGTGRIEEVKDRSGNAFQDIVSAQSDAVNSIARLKSNLLQASLSTLDPGYAVGQLVTLNIAKRKINHTMFIDEITFDDTMEESFEWDYNIKCISTARRITGVDVLRSLFGVSGSQVALTATGASATVGPVDPPSGLSYTPALFSPGVFSVENIALTTPNGVTGIDWWLIAVDELNEDLFCTLNADLNNTADNTVINVTPNPANSSAALANFVDGDWILFNTAGSFEWAQLTSKSGTAWTIQRHYPGTTSGEATFESLMASHASGTQVFKGTAYKFTQPAPVGGFIGTGVGIDRFDMPIRAVCVGAVVAAPYNSAGFGSWIVYNTATSVIPGIRTCVGGEFFWQQSGNLAAASGVNKWVNFAVENTQTIRTAYAQLQTAPVGASAKVRIRRSLDGGSTWATLYELVIAAGDKNSYPSIDTPYGRQYPYSGDWPFPSLKEGQLLNYSIEQIGSITAGADLTIKLPT